MNLLKKFWTEFRIEVGIVILGFVVMNLIFIADAFRVEGKIERGAAGQLGDFVGGYVGTLFALVSVVLLFATLKNQRRAAQEQNFEAKYFELVKMHRDNVAELELQKTTGRKIFVLLIREFRSILKIVKEVSQNCHLNYSYREKLNIAYYCLFFGVGPNSSRMLTNSLEAFDRGFVSQLVRELERPDVKENVKKEAHLDYVPFEGHQSRLGHYYRHLYQTVCYVDKQTFPLDKYEYVKTIRAQLTTHEQGLLLLNSLSPLGNEWWRKELITKYKMVQNIPKEFFHPSLEVDVAHLFKAGYFEWEESALTP